ncbi:aldehyde dehydrogenase family protein [Streptococcus merionis]|uniref:aldehyde dehydrogenase family protein n=1 Tax=Streptococcus merionis TaxID=400065 RepID=UPI0026E92AF2|nr:aldehyde dehydrogenase family protein [Streptococcus merionis]
MRYIDKDLDAIQEARNSLQNAQMVANQLKQLMQYDLDSYSAAFIEEVLKEKEQLIDDFVQGNGYGTVEDETELCVKFLERFTQTIQSERYVGIIGGNVADKTIEIGVPLGVVAVLLPTHPTFTLLVNLLLLAIKSGNSLILVANTLSKASTIKSLRNLVTLSEKCGFPEGSIVILENSGDAAVLELLASDKLSLIVNIGCPEYVTKAFQTNTPLIYGGESSGPVFIEHTADIKQAVWDLIHSRSFNNGILPGAEQFLVTEDTIADELVVAMKASGAYLLTAEDLQRLISFLKQSQKNIVDNYIGKSAVWIADQAGISVPPDTKVLVSVQDYMNEEDFFNQKLLCPIILVYLEPDWTLACTKCMRLLAELKMGHTLTIHSKNWQVIQEFALVKAVGRIVVNAPTACTATGIISAFAPSLILGGITTGRGFSSENITPKHWTYTRKIGFALE